MNTKVVMIALKAAEPQSQEAQARIWPLLTAWLPVSSSDGGCCASDAVAEFMTRCYRPFSRNQGQEWVRPLGKLDTLNPTNDRQLQPLIIESLTLRRYQ